MVGVALGREHVGEHFSNDLATGVTQANLDSTISTTNEQLAGH